MRMLLSPNVLQSTGFGFAGDFLEPRLNEQSTRYSFNLSLAK